MVLPQTGATDAVSAGGACTAATVEVSKSGRTVMHLTIGGTPPAASSGSTWPGQHHADADQPLSRPGSKAGVPSAKAAGDTRPLPGGLRPWPHLSEDGGVRTRPRWSRPIDRERLRGDPVAAEDIEGDLQASHRLWPIVPKLIGNDLAAQGRGLGVAQGRSTAPPPSPAARGRRPEPGEDAQPPGRSEQAEDVEQHRRRPRREPTGRSAPRLTSRQPLDAKSASWITGRAMQHQQIGRRQMFRDRAAGGRTPPRPRRRPASRRRDEAAWDLRAASITARSRWRAPRRSADARDGQANVSTCATGGALGAKAFGEPRSDPLAVPPECRQPARCAADQRRRDCGTGRWPGRRAAPPGPPRPAHRPARTTRSCTARAPPAPEVGGRPRRQSTAQSRRRQRAVQVAGSGKAKA